MSNGPWHIEEQILLPVPWPEDQDGFRNYLFLKLTFGFKSRDSRMNAIYLGSAKNYLLILKIAPQSNSRLIVVLNPIFLEFIQLCKSKSPFVVSFVQVLRWMMNPVAYLDMSTSIVCVLNVVFWDILGVNVVISKRMLLQINCGIGSWMQAETVAHTSIIWSMTREGFFAGGRRSTYVEYSSGPRTGSS